MFKSEPLTPVQFAEICQIVKAKFEAGAGDFRFKYVEPTYDVRTDWIYRVEFNGFLERRLFDTRDEDEDDTRPMFERIVEWIGPVPMHIHCPKCGLRHQDPNPSCGKLHHYCYGFVGPTGDFFKGCGNEWSHENFPTYGVPAGY